MSNLAKFENKNIEKKLESAPEVWKQIEQIRALFAPTLTDKEFMFFVKLGKSLGANPFLREIWAIKFNSQQPAQIFLGRDFYRRKAQELPNYNGHIVDAVYENDEFVVENGKPIHRYSLKNRGRLIGAYCVVHRKDTGNPYFVYVNLDEYDKGFSNWKIMPETMLKKVAESQALRGAFQGVFAGTYDESESWHVETVEDPVTCEAPETAEAPIAPTEASPTPIDDDIKEVIKELEKQGFKVSRGKESGDYYVAGNSYGKVLVKRLLGKYFKLVGKKDGQEIYKIKIA